MENKTKQNKKKTVQSTNVKKKGGWGIVLHTNVLKHCIKIKSSKSHFKKSAIKKLFKTYKNLEYSLKLSFIY